MLQLHVRAAATAALLASLATSGAAQERRTVVYGPDRPRIGVMLETEANAEHDKYGAYVTDVTPDGPAAKAGIKAGDIITSFNGVSLAGVSGDGEESGPSRRLRELAAKLEAGDTVRLEYRRGTQSLKATLVAEELPAMTFRRLRSAPGAFHFETPRGDFIMRGPEGGWRFSGDGPGQERVIRLMEGGLFGLDLATVNAGLGEYFGAKSGALVLDVPADSAIHLKPGDVIVAIDGRAVTSEEQARRILRSYADGETAKVEVMRQKKKATVTWKAPEAGEFPAPYKVRVRSRAPEPMKAEAEKD